MTERPRSGARIKAPKGERRYKDYSEDAPKKEKIRRKWQQGAGKEFTDVLGPLYGYLRKQVGRPWDKVYSEISQNLPKNSMQNIHIHTHIWQFVEKNVIIVDGIPCYGDSINYGAPLDEGRPYSTLYIHPTTGLLCQVKRPKKKKKEPQIVEPGIKVYPGVQYHKLNKVWFEVKVRPYNYNLDGITSPYFNYIRDEVLDRYYESIAELRRVYGGLYMAVSKRPLTKKEMKFSCLK